MENQINIANVTDFSEILDTYGVSYFPMDQYWQVGEIARTQGWIIHLSVILAQVRELIQVIVPELMVQKVPFKVVRDVNTAVDLLEAGYGYTTLGKMISIYPEDDAQARYLAESLIHATSSFRGPAIPTDRHLGSIVYTRYGSFNPIYTKNKEGELVKHIYDTSGQLVPDPYDIPFRLPEGIAWPYQGITTAEITRSGKLLNNKYYPLVIIKPDAKGFVIKALYFKKAWQIKSCLIKQGKQGMFADYASRDIRDRLKWQYDLYQLLHNDIPMPEIFDFFKERESVYLVMKFIKGKTLTSWLHSIHHERCWRDLNKPERIQLLDQFLRIIDIISRLHEKGFVHRDITPENFLIDKKGRIWLIDMELVWSSSANPPQPPFQLGSPGHMSPEQMATQTPTVKEDIFGIGSMMITFFTSLHALKFLGQTPEQLEQSLDFYIDEPPITQLIISCWDEVPSERPVLGYVESILKHYRNKIDNSLILYNKADITLMPETEAIKNVIQAGLNYFGSPDLLSANHRWASLSQRQETYVGNRQVTREMYEGWHTGMAGPLWLVAIAKNAGFDVSRCQLPYAKSWEYIDENYFSRPEKVSPGLYAGSAGIALALAAGMNSGMLQSDGSNIEQLQRCFSMYSPQPDLAEGIAGQGLALLQCRWHLDEVWVQRALASYVDAILQLQDKRGHWGIHTGLDRGTAGILLFLLSYVEHYPNPAVIEVIRKSLHRLKTVATKTKSIDHWTTGHGMPGIILTFLKAYKVLKGEHYLRIAESCLMSTFPSPVLMDLSLANGLAGLGEVYLEAYRVTNEIIWQERAAWIVRQLLTNFKSSGPDEGYWLTFINIVTTADLFSGNGGMLHLFMRFLFSDKINHPLL
ncbi:MAG: protein kinase [Chitinophagaceae bacterium]|nr:protein kinase [Chitinophagaceae bacterium]